MILPCLHIFLFSFGLVCLLVVQLLGIQLHTVVGLLHEIFIGFLLVLFRPNCLRLHCLGIADDCLQHLDDTSRMFIVFVCRETGRRRGPSRLLALQKSGLFLCIPILQHLERTRKYLLRLPLVCNNDLELIVCLLTVLTSTLQLHLAVSNRCLQLLNRLGQCADLELKILNQGNQVCLGLLIGLSLAFVGVKLIHAEILLLDFIRLLLHQMFYHLVNCRLHFCKRIQTHLYCQCGKMWIIQLLGNGRKKL
mmetsp:Transcript_21751/g.40003  ORF Transcript_21751/g.40003 Transcript_21751/m.40003 type:complete len:250 (-) Transcript_21751:1236-1985(-)